jgi:hypothetical protein
MKSQKKAGKFSLTLLPVIVLALAVTPVLQAEQVRVFSATISPTTVNAGATDSYTITITNDASSTKLIHTAKAIVPAGFTGVSITTPNPTASDGKAWTAALVGTEIRLSASGGTNKLPAGESVSVSFNATAPGIAGPYEWTTTAYQEDNWIDTPFTLTGLQPTVTVIASSYIFAGWRPPVQLPDPAQGPAAWNSGRTMPVKFLVVDGSGTPATSGVVANVQIGSSAIVAATLDDATIGQWKAEIEVVGSGTQAVTITGNVTGVTALSIVVVENP